jgi:hypothetical protein
MKTMKNLVLAVIVFGFVAATSSCNKHTCPTYSKTNETVQTDRV